MRFVLAVLGYAGVAGALAAAFMLVWHAGCIARLGGIGLLTSSFRFLDRSRHQPAVAPHVGALWRWFGLGVASLVLLGIGARAL